MWFRKYDLLLAMAWSCHECWVSVRVRCWAMRRRREERGGADTCSETRGPRHIPPSLGRITLHTVHITHYIHYTYRSHQPGNVWIPLGAGRSWPISPAQDHHFRLTPPSLGLCIIANDSLTEIPRQCHLQPLEGYHWIMWYCALNLIYFHRIGKINNPVHYVKKARAGQVRQCGGLRAKFSLWGENYTLGALYRV